MKADIRNAARTKARAEARTAARTDCYVAYCRVSTEKQGASGLGLEAQEAAIRAHVGPGKIIASFVEVESGKFSASDRPELAAALVECELHHATLIVAKLDRLGRDVHFLSGLMQSGVNFIAVDNPNANKLTLHILAAMAEYEREQISARTIAGLAAAKARGTILGNPQLKPGDARVAAIASAANAELAAERAQRYASKIAEARASGATSLEAIAVYLTMHNTPTPRGGERWCATQVRRVLAKLTADAA